MRLLLPGPSGAWPRAGVWAAAGEARNVCAHIVCARAVLATGVTVQQPSRAWPRTVHRQARLVVALGSGERG